MSGRTSILQIGELREYVAKDMHIQLEKVINRYSSRQELYWILVHSKWDDGPMPQTNTVRKHITPELYKVRTENVLRTNLVIMPTKPTHVLVGTMCIEVDNKAGTKKLLWNLPMDAPRPAGIGQEKGTENEAIYESARQTGAIAHG